MALMSQANVRTEAVNTLTKLWASAYTEMSVYYSNLIRTIALILSELKDEKAIKQFAWIPNTMLSTLAVIGAPVDHR
jgi:hypothetical protein